MSVDEFKNWLEGHLANCEEKDGLDRIKKLIKCKQENGKSLVLRILLKKIMNLESKI
jgi:hypothetical protein